MTPTTPSMANGAAANRRPVALVLGICIDEESEITSQAMKAFFLTNFYMFMLVANIWFCSITRHGEREIERKRDMKMTRVESQGCGLPNHEILIFVDDRGNFVSGLGEGCLDRSRVRPVSVSNSYISMRLTW